MPGAYPAKNEVREKFRTDGRPGLDSGVLSPRSTIAPTETGEDEHGFFLICKFTPELECRGAGLGKDFLRPVPPGPRSIVGGQTDLERGTPSQNALLHGDVAAGDQRF